MKMIFTPWQLVTLIVITEIVVYVIFVNILYTIERCSLYKAFSICLEMGLITPNDFKNIIKEEMKDENK